MGRHYRSPCTLYLSILLASLCTAIPKVLTGQAPSASGEHSGQIQDQVSDPAGLAVPNAGVTLWNVLTGTATTARTSVEGTFIFRNLAPGSYALTASAKGLVLNPRRVEVKGDETFDASHGQMSMVGTQEQVVVSASRVTELQGETPTKVLSVTKDEIQSMGYENVSDVLSEVLGVVTRAQSYGVGLVAGEQIDGMDSKEIFRVGFNHTLPRRER